MPGPDDDGIKLSRHQICVTINIPPTLTQNQGAEFTIIVARDLDFSSVNTLEPEGAP